MRFDEQPLPRDQGVCETASRNRKRGLPADGLLAFDRLSGGPRRSRLSTGTGTGWPSIQHTPRRIVSTSEEKDMTAPEDRRDQDRFQESLVEEEQAAGAYQPEEDGVPDADPDEDLAAGPPDGQ
jgi:hypothetical protein